MTQRPYRVVETELFTAQAESLLGSMRRWDEIAETLMSDLPRDPHAFEAVPATGFRAVGLNTLPSRTVYFTVNDDDGEIILEGLL